MTHSYKQHYFHLIWSTKNRVAFIKPEIQSRLYNYMSAVAINYEAKILEIGGMKDHVHLLVEFSNLDCYTNFIRDIKSNSSKWISQTFPDIKDFSWQEGFASYTVSYSSLEAVRKYIQNQEEHHKVLTFEEEYRKLLNLCNVKYDDRFCLG